MIDLRRYELSKNEKTILYLCIGFCSILLSLLCYKSIFYAIFMIPFFEKIVSFYKQHMIEKRKREFLLQFKDFLFIAATSIGGGRSMKDAIYESIHSLEEIYGEKAILIKQLSNVYERMNEGGESDLVVLSDFARSCCFEDVIDFVSMYSICKTTGASLIISMNRAASVIIDKMTIEKEIEEIINRKKNEGLLIFAMPFIVIIFLNIFSPDYIAPLYETFTGKIIMTAVIGADIGIYGVIKKVTDVQI